MITSIKFDKWIPAFAGIAARNLFVLLIAFCILTLKTDSQWQQAPGPPGGTINGFTMSGSNWFAGVYGTGIYISSNSGVSWSAVNTGLPQYFYIYGLASIGSNVFAAIYNSGVYESTNNGASWFAVISGLTNYYNFTIYSAGTTLFTGTQNGSFVSTNNGALWTYDSTGMGSKTVYAYSSYGSYIFAGTSSNGVYVSTNNGTSWTAVNSGLTNANITSLTNYPNGSGNTLIAGTRGGGVFLSTNNGSSWTAIISGLTNDLSIQAVVAFSNGSGGYNLFAGTAAHGVYLSTNASSWSQVITGLTENNILSFLSSGTTVLAGGNTGGVFLTSNSGTAWINDNNGIYGVDVVALLEVGTTIFAGMYGGGGVFVSTNSGTNWSASGLPYAALSDFAYHNGELYASTFNNGTGMYKSTNMGATWTSIANGLATYEQVIGAANNGYLYTGGFSGVYRSTNDGASWQADTTGFNGCPSVYSVEGCGSRFFEGTQYCSNGGGLFITTNYGSSWQNVGYGASFVDAILTVPNPLGGNYLYMVDGSLFGGSVYLSQDSGTTWQQTQGGPTTALCIANSGTIIFAGTNGAGVYFSSNNGTNWSSDNSGLGNLRVKSICADSQYVYAGTIYNSIYRRHISELVGNSNITQSVPKSYVLYQNYPNPFNPSTVIQFTIPVGDAYMRPVQLKIYDILGKEVATLVNGEISAGKHEVEWNATNFPSGVYFYKLTVGSFTETKKMLMIK